MNITYLASPYTSDINATQISRYEAACRACYLLSVQGVQVYSPICHWHPIVELGYHVKYETLIAIDLEILQHCKELYVLCLYGWEKSSGVQREIEHAKKYKLKISYHTITDILTSMST